MLNFLQSTATSSNLKVMMTNWLNNEECEHSPVGNTGSKTASGAHDACYVFSAKFVDFVLYGGYVCA
jgi:hypothetical protein